MALRLLQIPLQRGFVVIAASLVPRSEMTQNPAMLNPKAMAPIVRIRMSSTFKAGRSGGVAEEGVMDFYDDT